MLDSEACAIAGREWLGGAPILLNNPPLPFTPPFRHQHNSSASIPHSASATFNSKSLLSRGPQCRFSPNVALKNTPASSEIRGQLWRGPRVATTTQKRCLLPCVFLSQPAYFSARHWGKNDIGGHAIVTPRLFLRPYPSPPPQTLRTNKHLTNQYRVNLCCEFGSGAQ
jgi:hypothetical protein